MLALVRRRHTPYGSCSACTDDLYEDHGLRKTHLNDLPESGCAVRENGVDYEKVNYFIYPLDAEQLRTLIRKLGVPAFDLLRKKEPQFKELGLTETTPADQIIAAIVANPGLLNRPIVEVGDKAVIARPVERALELLRSDK